MDSKTRMAKVADFLKTIDYKTEFEGEALRAHHDDWLGFTCHGAAEGVLMEMFLRMQDDRPRPDVLEFINELNQQTLVISFSLDQDGDFACRAWYQGPFQTDSFEQFMLGWHHDLSVLFENEKSSQMLA